MHAPPMLGNKVGIAKLVIHMIDVPYPLTILPGECRLTSERILLSSTFIFSYNGHLRRYFSKKTEQFIDS